MSQISCFYVLRTVSTCLCLGWCSNVDSHLSMPLVSITVVVHSPGLLLWYCCYRVISYNLDWLRSLCLLRITLQVDSRPTIPSAKTWEKLGHHVECQSMFSIMSTVNIFPMDKSGGMSQCRSSVYFKVVLILSVSWWVLCSSQRMFFPYCFNLQNDFIFSFFLMCMMQLAFCVNLLKEYILSRFC